MKKMFWLLALILVLSALSNPTTSDQTSAVIRKMKTEIEKTSIHNYPDFGEAPLYFIPNSGQFDEQASFCARASFYTLWITGEGLVFDFAWKQDSGLHDQKARKQIFEVGTNKASPKFESDVSRLRFPNSNCSPDIAPLEPSAYRVNYFLGNDPSKWVEDVGTYTGILYKDIYPHIDLKVYGVEKEIEYDWIVRPGGEASSIMLEYQDVEGTRIDQERNLVVATRFGEVVHRKPLGYQLIAGRKVNVDVDFKRLKDNSFAFKTGTYDRTHELIIDPVVLIFSTFLGGNGWDNFGAIAVDSTQCVYVAGGTFSTNFPVKSAYDPTHNGNEDVFVTKFNKSGKGLVYSTFIGGPMWEEALCMTLDKSNNVYFGGLAYDGFPTKNAYDDDYDDSLHGDYYDAIVVKLSPTGKLVYSTYLGKAEDDEAIGIAVDSAGRACVGGVTRNSDFPTKNAIRPSYKGKTDVFVTIFSAAGNSLLFSTFFGGSEYETLGGLALDDHGYIYIAGFTWSKDFPIKNAYDSSHNGKTDAFLAKLGPLGKSLVYSTFLGGGDYDIASGIAVDDSGSAHLTGWTSSKNFPKKNAYDKTQNGEYDVFATKFAPNGQSLVYSTYIGGSKSDSGVDIALDSVGAACVVGITHSPDFPCFGAYNDSINGSVDAFVFKLSSNGSALLFSTYLGGSAEDRGLGIAMDKVDDIYVAGETCSTDFPTKKAYDTTFNGGEYDIFVTKFK